MAQSAKCTECGMNISPNSLFGLCAHCLLKIANSAEEGEMKVVDLTTLKDRRFGDYILHKQIGSGGMGVVYEAEQVSLSRKVALKFIREAHVASPHALRRFKLEAEAAARLHHPNIVPIHDIGEEEGQPFISMDLIDGENLKYKVERGDFAIRRDDGSKTNCRAKQVRIARLMVKIARAVHHAHERGVLHRDLKPANVLLDKADEPHLTDFGLAKIFHDSPDTATRVGWISSLTGKGDIPGTPSYMAPEQVSNGPPTLAADVYGLGAILYELLTGKPPFVGSTPFETLKQVQEQRPVHPHNVDSLIEKDLDTICMKCLEKDPQYRYASAEALATDLENWIEHKPIKARKASVPRLAIQWTRRNPLGATFIITLFLGLVAALLMLDTVEKQKNRIDMEGALLFDEVVYGLSQKWKDPKSDALTVESKHLRILAGKPTNYQLQKRRVSVGISIIGDPISFAQWRSTFLVALEDRITKSLGEPVLLDLKLFKHGLVDDFDLLATGKADFMFVDPLSYLRAKAKADGVKPLAQEKDDDWGVIVVNTNRMISDLRELIGKSVALGMPDDTLTLYAKAQMLLAGVARTNLDMSAPHPPKEPQAASFGAQRQRIARRETIMAVVKGQMLAGVTTRRRYELQKHHGLAKLDEFRSTPELFAARPGLAPELFKSIQAALVDASPSAELSTPAKETFDWEDPFPGAIRVDDSDFNHFRQVVAKAAQFDGISYESILHVGAVAQSPAR